MNSGDGFWAKIIKRVAARLSQLVIIVIILLAIFWINREWAKIREANNTAKEYQTLAARIEQELEPLQKRRVELESRLKSDVAKISSAEGLQKIAKETLRKKEADLKKIRDAEPLIHWKPTYPADYYLKLSVAEGERNLAKNAYTASQKSLSAIRADLEKSPVGKELSKISDQIEAKNKDIETFLDRAKSYHYFSAQHPLGKAWQAVLGVLPTALKILAGIILVPIGIKAFFYWVVAPLCSKAKPLVIVPDQGVGLKVQPSNISVSVSLKPGDKLIVHSRYLQASGTGPGRRTKFLYSWKFPLTSLAAGLYALIQVSNADKTTKRVTISPKGDLFDELTSVEIPAGESLVIYPRSIAAIVQRADTPPLLDRRWRICNIHSLMTFQFRYLMIKGDCEIILRGCRGIRAEYLDENNNDRMQDLGSTLGFSPGIGYSTVRCETFMDYLLGRDQLFNDRFRGTNGLFLSDEIPDPRRTAGGIFGRGLEGVVDTFLKGFGIC